MNGFAFFVGGVLPYLAVGVFVAGMIYRVWVWIKTPQPGKMTLFPAPAPGSTQRRVVAEALFFPSLFKGDRALWFISWTFHVMLALVFLGHLRVVTGLIDELLMKLGMSADAINTMSSTVGGGAGIILLATGVLLLIRRLTMSRVREISNASDFFALLLLLAIIVTGDLMRFTGAHFELEQTRIWALSLLTFSPTVPTHGMFLAHAMMGQLLLMYIPFSKILHFGGIFFTQALVRR